MNGHPSAARYSFLHTEVNAMTMEQTVNWIESRIQSRKPVQHVVINASKVVLMADQPELRAIINNCELINIDGQAVVWAAKLLGIPVPERVTGVDLMFRLLDLAEQRQYRIFILGAEEHILMKALHNLRMDHPAIQIAGYHHGYYRADEEQQLIQQIAQSRADMLFVAMPSPKKEFWLHRHMNDLNVPFCMGVGGSIDILAGHTRRAPLWMQKLGLEWCYRFLQEPRRMWKRYLVGNARFVFLVAKGWITLIRGKSISARGSQHESSFLVYQPNKSDEPR